MANHILLTDTNGDDILVDLSRIITCEYIEKVSTISVFGPVGRFEIEIKETPAEVFNLIKKIKGRYNMKGKSKTISQEKGYGKKNRRKKTGRAVSKARRREEKGWEP